MQQKPLTPSAGAERDYHVAAESLGVTLPGPTACSTRSLLADVFDYIAIARPDHWFKNVFMIIGVVLAYFYRPELLPQVDVLQLGLALLATCLIASSNYVLNEILDAPTDRAHPEKCHRPLASGRLLLSVAYAEWLLLAVLGFAIACTVNQPFLLTAVGLWVMGLVYNVRPIRSKELPYLDVLSESVNNPLRLALGWFAVTAAMVPPLSLLICYWMVGTFFMTSKRFAEYRHIGDPQRAAAYRASFAYYDENRLLISMFFYATAAALFLGVFIVRYHLELILSVPLMAGFFSYYMRVALKPDSPVQAPERLYREHGLMCYLLICLASFLVLMFIRIDLMYEVFNVAPSELPPLWKF